jgi:hypothetical protein
MFHSSIEIKFLKVVSWAPTTRTPMEPTIELTTWFREVKGWRTSVLLVFCLGLTLVPVHAQTSMFVPGPTFSPPLSPLYVLTGDFNNDNIRDFIVLSDEGTGVPANAYVFLGNGDGTFKPPNSYPLGTLGLSMPAIPAQGVLVINNNGPPIQDLVVPIAQSNTINVLMGKGDGTFLPFTTYRVDEHPTAAVVAGEDGTAYPELAVVASGTNNQPSVSILLGHGDGTFGPATIIPLANSPTSIASNYLRHGVFNTDLVIGTSSGIAVLLGNGQGTFQPEVDYPLSSGVTSVAVDDFNGDSFPDIAATHGNVVSILLGNGDGTFQTPRDYPVGNGARSLFVAQALLASDFTNDRHDDLVVTNLDDNTFSVLLGNGDGTFQPALTFPVNGTGPNSIGVADFNSDGAPDLVVTTKSGSAPGSSGSAFTFLNTRGTSATVTCSPDLVQSGQPTTCTATYSAALPAMPVPTGNVTFGISNAALPAVCSGSLDETGKMQCQGGAFLGIGGWGVSADYSGDKNYDPGLFLSPTVLTVDALNFNPPGPLSSTVAAGRTAQFALLLQDMVGYGGSIGLTCTGAPLGATCSVPANVKLPGQINATVSTTSRMVAVAPRRHSPSWLWAMGVLGLVLLPGVYRRNGRHTRFARTLPFCFLLLLASCGSGNSGNTSNPNGTPAGTYTLTVTATAGGLKSSISLILTVQ